MFTSEHFEVMSAVASRVAPENESKLVELSNKHDFSLLFLKEPGFTFRVNTKTKVIKIPYGGLEYLWAFSLKAWLLYQVYAQAQLNGEQNLDLETIDGYAGISQLTEDLKESLYAENYDSNKNFSALINVEKIDQEIATEIFLCALGWIIWHEIAHIELGHSSLEVNTLSIQEEKDADLYSTNWILSSSTITAESKKRIVGITIALLAIQSLELDSKSCFKGTHPDASNRIFDNLSQHSEIGDEISQAMSIVMLQSMTKIDIAPMNDLNFSDMLGEALYQINVNKR